MRRPRVFATSDGSGVVGSGDQWIGTDGNGTPAIITYIDGPLSLQPTSVSLNGDDLQWTYNITVAAGTTVQPGAISRSWRRRPRRPPKPRPTPWSAAAVLAARPAAFLSSGELQSLANFANPSPVLTPPPPPTEGTALSNVNLLPLLRHQRRRTSPTTRPRSPGATALSRP